MDGTNPTFDMLSSFAASWGSLYFAAMFVIALAYALWPSKRDQFDHAARIPLSED
jgi:cytochrome c oxidase cbb3-type subunit 4